MFGAANSRNTLQGTTSPIMVPRKDIAPSPVRLGEDYFLIQIHSAQAAFSGHIWEHVKRLVVTSQVNLNHPLFGNEAVRAIQRTREVEKERAEQLGLSPNLVRLMPATMTQISVTLEFLLDKENRLAQIGGLINDDAFLSTISLAPGAALVAKTISGLSQKILQTFVPSEEREPILQFTGDFNIAGAGLMDAYYVILGSRDDDNPLPDPMPTLEVRPDGLYAAGDRVTQLSYVILSVCRTGARGRQGNDGAPWDAKLREAEQKARFAGKNPMLKEDRKAAAWEDCLKILEEARTLLLSDPNYLPSEADAILAASFDLCSQHFAPPTMKSLVGTVTASMAQFGIDPSNKDSLLERYAEQLVDARERLKDFDGAL